MSDDKSNYPGRPRQFEDKEIIDDGNDISTDSQECKRDYER